MPELKSKANRKSMPHRRRPSGASYVRSSGRKSVLLTFTPSEKLAIQRAAERDGRTMAGFLQHYGLAAAAKVGK